MACSSSCLTRDHQSWGDCVRSKGIKTHVETPGTGYDPAKNKAWDRRIDSYRAARAEGIQPAGTSKSQIDAAVRTSDATGTAFVAS